MLVQHSKPFGVCTSARWGFKSRAMLDDVSSVSIKSEG